MRSNVPNLLLIYYYYYYFVWSRNGWNGLTTLSELNRRARVMEQLGLFFNTPIMFQHSIPARTKRWESWRSRQSKLSYFWSSTASHPITSYHSSHNSSWRDPLHSTSIPPFHPPPLISYFIIIISLLIWGQWVGWRQCDERVSEWVMLLAPELLLQVFFSILLD